MSNDAQFREHCDQAITDQREAGRVERLDNVIEGAFAQKGFADFGVGAGARDKYRDGGILAAHDAEKRERPNAAGIGDGDVQGDQGGSDGAKELERLKRVFGLRDDLATDTFEVVAQDVADEHGIIDHQDAHRHLHTTLAPPARRRSVPCEPEMNQ